MSKLYSAYGLCIQSEWHIPQLLDGTGGSPDIIIRHAHDVDEFPQSILTQQGWHLTSADDITLNAGLLGVYRARNGRELIALPPPDIDSTTLTNFFITMALNLLLFQRGILLLHASVVVVDGGAAAFLGASGWGKSTLAASLEMRGHRVIADDTLALDMRDPARPLALSAFPQMKLYPDSLELVGIEAETLPRVQNLRTGYGADDKRFRLFADHFDEQSAPLKRLYILNKSDTLGIERLSRGDAFPDIMTHSFVGKIAAQFGVDLLIPTYRAAAHLHQITQLLDAVPVCRLHRRWNLDIIDRAAALVERDLAESPEFHKIRSADADRARANDQKTEFQRSEDGGN